MIDEKIIEVFKYLDELKDSGIINMFAAGPYLSGRFNLNKGDADSVLKHWMETFNEDATPEERVAQDNKNAQRSIQLMDSAFSLDDDPDFVYDPFPYEDVN